MKEIYTQLYPNEQVARAVGDYAFTHSTPLPKHLVEHHAWGVRNSVRPDYMISPLQAGFQLWFAKAMGVKRSMYDLILRGNIMIVLGYYSCSVC
jgi:hypothetical protein